VVGVQPPNFAITKQKQINDMTKIKFLKLMLAASFAMSLIIVGPPIDILLRKGPIMRPFPGQPPIILLNTSL